MYFEFVSARDPSKDCGDTGHRRRRPDLVCTGATGCRVCIVRDFTLPHENQLKNQYRRLDDHERLTLERL